MVPGWTVCFFFDQSLRALVRGLALVERGESESLCVHAAYSGKHVRQTILLSDFLFPDANALFNKRCNNIRPMLLRS